MSKLSYNSRIKKNVYVKFLYSLMNFEGYLVFFHNNKPFARTRMQLLFPNLLTSHILKNSVFYKLFKSDSIFHRLVVGPTGLIVLPSDEHLLAFLTFFFKVYIAGQMECILLSIFWVDRNRFLSLEYCNTLLNDILNSGNLNQFVDSQYKSFFLTLCSVYINFVLFLNNILLSFFFNIALLKKK